MQGFLLSVVLLLGVVGEAAPTVSNKKLRKLNLQEEVLSVLKDSSKNSLKTNSPPLAFDLPITYNTKVRRWIRFFQSRGRDNFRLWLQRSNRYFPEIRRKLVRHQMPQDLVYLAMIESGLSSVAKSHANAVGPWQFIRETANRFGLRVHWWLDERKNFEKSTEAAIEYLKVLHKEFNSWYLVFASYNMGENGVRRRIRKHKTNDYWKLVKKEAIPKETQEYVPKLIAAMLIAKAPGLYGFRNIKPLNKLDFEEVHIPGGTNISGIADYLGVSRRYLRYLNAELVHGFVPENVSRHKIKIPKGSRSMVARYIRENH